MFNFFKKIIIFVLSDSLKYIEKSNTYSQKFFYADGNLNYRAIVFYFFKNICKIILNIGLYLIFTSLCYFMVLDNIKKNNPDTYKYIIFIMHIYITYYWILLNKSLFLLNGTLFSKENILFNYIFSKMSNNILFFFDKFSKKYFISGNSNSYKNIKQEIYQYLYFYSYYFLYSLVIKISISLLLFVYIITLYNYIHIIIFINLILFYSAFIVKYNGYLLLQYFRGAELLSFIETNHHSSEEFLIVLIKNYLMIIDKYKKYFLYIFYFRQIIFSIFFSQLLFFFFFLYSRIDFITYIILILFLIFILIWFFLYKYFLGKIYFADSKILNIYFVFFYLCWFDLPELYYMHNYMYNTIEIFKNY